MAKAEREPFFPEVKQVYQAEGSFILPSQGLIIKAGKQALQAAEWMAAALKSMCDLEIVIHEDELPRIALVVEQSVLEQNNVVKMPQHAEGYICSISENGIFIQANTYRGFLYGWYAMEQWIKARSRWTESELAVANVTFADWPDLFVRGHHFDFKGSVPFMSYVKETIARLAKLRINTLLIEYEDQFPYTSLPHVHKQNGFTPQEITEMLDCAEQYGMEVIPFIQSIGHVDFVLKHEAYRHLCEDGLTFQYCPCHPGSLALFKKMIDEMIVWHPNSSYIHIGADEAMALGRCERCMAWIEQPEPGTEGRTKVDLYMNYVKQAAEYVLLQGKKPIIWDDMFHSEKCVERMSELPLGTAVSSWSYYDNGRSSWVWWAGSYYTSKQWLEKDPGVVARYSWLEDLPDDEQAMIRKLWDAGEYPLYGTNNIPWITEYKEHVTEIFGASCVRGADHTNQWFASQEDRVQNVMFWSKYAKENGLTGVISSAWTRFYSLSPSIEPWESGWYPLAAHACFSWHASTSRESFDLLWTDHFADGDPLVLKAIKLMEKGASAQKSQYYYAAQQVLKVCQYKQNTQLQRYVELLLSAAEFSELCIQLEIALKDVEWVMYVKEKQPLDNDVVMARGFKLLDERLSAAQQWEMNAISQCQAWMAEAEVEEMVMSKLHPFKVRAETVENFKPKHL